MSIKVMDRVWEHSKATGTPLVVLLCLADWANDDGECWPPISKIGKKCRLKDMPDETVVDRPPSSADDRGSQTTPDGGPSTTPDGGSQTPRTVNESSG
jgi:hypothetical protein